MASSLQMKIIREIQRRTKTRAEREREYDSAFKSIDQGQFPFFAFLFVRVSLRRASLRTAISGPRAKRCRSVDRSCKLT
jgi:hypothetical protein